MNRLETLSLAVDRWIMRLLFAMGLSMTLVVALQVLFRYGLNRSLFWSGELARFLLVWLTFLGASSAYRRGMHPGVDVLTARLPGKLRRGLSVFVHLLSLAFFGAMVVYGAAFAFFVRLQISPALGLSKWWVMSVIPVSGAVCLIHGLALLVEAKKESARPR